MVKHEAIDNGMSYDILYLAFSNAFDKAPHHRLLKKVRMHGTDRKILGWIKAQLSERHQRVVINGSGNKCRATGISFRATIILNIYINDLDSGIKSDISKFKDDMKISRIIQSVGLELS